MHALLREFVFSVLEKTAWKKHNVDFDPIEDLRKQVNNGAYVTFTSVNKIGVNPQFAYTHPLGIWTYPLNDTTFDQITSGNVRFGGKRKYVQIVKPRHPGAILDIDSIDGSEVDGMLGFLESISKEEIPEKVLNVSDPSERLQKGIKALANGDVKRQSQLYQQLGLDGILFTSKNIAVFFNINAINHVGMVHNPFASDEPEF